MRRHLANAAWGALDYAAYPAAMLFVAPVVLRRLGPAQYGLWTVSTALISAGGIIASGFGDANIQRVAQLRGHCQRTLSEDAHAAMVGTVRNLLSLHLLLGAMLALAVWCAAPLLSARLVHDHSHLAGQSVIAMRIAALLILVRALETVPVSTQRAFESFGPLVRINTAVRLATVGTAAALAFKGHSVVALLLATALFLLAGTALQFQRLRQLLGWRAVLPAYDPNHLHGLLRTGLFTWVQALGSVVFGQLDRLVLGLSLGAVAVAPYALCVQFAHPIYGLTASALSFLFPYLSSHAGVVSRRTLAKKIGVAVLCNLALVSAGAVFVLTVGARLLRAWAGAQAAQTVAPILPYIVLGSALMGLGVTAACALLALGKFRLVAVYSLMSRAFLLLLIALLIRRLGASALVLVRAGYGLFAVALYVPLLRLLREPAAATASYPPTSSYSVEAFSPATEGTQS